MDISCPEVRTASTRNSTGWQRHTRGPCDTTRSTGSTTKLKANSQEPINPLHYDSFARSSRDPEMTKTGGEWRIGSHQGLPSGRRGTRTPDLSRVKATTHVAWHDARR